MLELYEKLVAFLSIKINEITGQMVTVYMGCKNKRLQWFRLVGLRVRLSFMQTEVESDHHWLMESLSGMDTIETEGDIEASHSHPASVHFDDGDVASDADSTESMCGSQENLLDSAAASLLHKSSSLRYSRFTT